MNDDDNYEPDPMDNVDVTPLNSEEDGGTSRRMEYGPAIRSTAPMASPYGNQFHNPGFIIVPPSKPGPKPLFKQEVWKLSNVPELPQFHPVEQRAVFVPDADPLKVSSRISAILHERSIEAIYDSDTAKVKCVTEEGVDFRIRLYRGRGEYRHGIIVEVQRRFGFSNAFHHESHAILDAALGKVPPPPVSNNLPLPSSAMMAEEDMDEEEPDGTSALDMVAKMLKHPGQDSTFLGLQTLVSLTDSAKIGKATALKVSNALLQPNCEVGSKVLSFILNDKDENLYKYRTLSMTILANTMSEADVEIPPMVVELVRVVLIRELKLANKNPRLAFHSARCVECLFMKNTAHAGDFHDALKVAEEAGMARHAGLQRQAKACLDKMY